MPKGAVYGTRSKFVHTQGTVATIKFTSSGKHPFTGIFVGADHGIVRLSFAGQPNPKVLNTLPGIAIKFLRDGVDSANVLAMYTIDGQKSWNFFKNDLSNHIPFSSSFTAKILADKF